MLLAATEKPQKAPDLVGPAAKGLEHDLLVFWPLWLLIALVALGKLAWRLYQRRRLSKSGIHEIDGMNGHTFEVYLSTLFRRLGYRVELTGGTGDFGADLLVTRGKKRIAVQAKCWRKNVGIKAVQEVAAAKSYYDCQAALVVTNREFTRSAQRLARKTNVELWGRATLVKKLLAARGVHDTPEQLVLEPAPLPPTTPAAAQNQTQAAAAICVTCGVTVSDKVRDYCLAHSARFGGRIYCFRHQRAVRTAPATD